MAAQASLSFRPRTRQEEELIRSIANYQGYDSLADFIRDTVVKVCLAFQEDVGKGKIAEHNRQMAEKLAALRELQERGLANRKLLAQKAVKLGLAPAISDGDPAGAALVTLDTAAAHRRDSD